MLSEHDKEMGMSDTAYYSEAMRGAFPRGRYGGSKAAIYAAFRFISPKVNKKFTERRARAIWEGTALRIDAEEAMAIKRAEIEEARREYRELQNRLACLEAGLAVADEAFHGPALDAYRAMARGLGKHHRT